jgi:polysaccharide pyruvyl transferase WcaK-like protein
MARLDAVQRAKTAVKGALRRLGLRRPIHVRSRPGKSGFRVLLAGGFGYRNAGDEAQLAACIKRWRLLRPEAEIIALSPDPAYTARLHEVSTRPASRNAFFQAHQRPDYVRSTAAFRSDFFQTKRRALFAAWCLRRGLPIMTASQEELDLLLLLAGAQVLHLTGGGYLTGMTLSRLWDHMLLLRLARSFGVRTVLSGQTIGVFGDRVNRGLARWGLKDAERIGLRDRTQSPAALAEIGISGPHVRTTFDDALFCDQLPAGEAMERLTRCRIAPGEAYAAVNFHDWGQSAELRPRAAQRFAALADRLIERHRLKVLFVPMCPADEEPTRLCRAAMAHDSGILEYPYDYKVARAIIGSAKLCLTMKHHPIVFAMGNAVPVVAAALDEYYSHKNKGALGLVGLEDFMLEKADFFSSTAFERIDEALASSADISAALRAWLGKARAEESWALSSRQDER